MNHEHVKKHVEKYDYIEGEKARENFESLAKKVFRATKIVASPVAAPKKSVRKRAPGKA